MSTVQSEITKCNKEYNEDLAVHPNILATQSLKPTLIQKRPKKKNVLWNPCFNLDE